jgi:hypothetical protein
MIHFTDDIGSRGVGVSKVLLLNPPGDRLYIRDQFCSHVSKGTYYWQPLDLLMLSATLDAEGYELDVVDAIAERMSPEETHSRIRRFAPDAAASAWRWGSGTSCAKRAIGCS